MDFHRGLHQRPGRQTIEAGCANDLQGRSLNHYDGRKEELDMTKTKVSKEAELTQQIVDLAKRARLDSWHEFVETLQVPSELIPALITMRPELIKLASVRGLTKDEAQALYTLIGALIETNMILRQHAQEVASMTKNWMGSVHGMVTVADRLVRFAEFRHADAAADDEEDEDD